MEENKEHQSVVVLPYIEGISQIIVNVLSQVEIRSALKAQLWQWKLCRGIKDVIPKEDCKGVVYEVSCKDCYRQDVEETFRTRVVRMQEHTRHAQNGRTDLSAVAAHAVVESHEIDWTTTKVIDTATNTRTRKVKEALHIVQKATSMNKDSGMSLSASWYASVMR